jgi:hypothetical protein
MTTRIRTTCTECSVALDVPSTRLVVDLPDADDDATPPQLLVPCPVCHRAGAVAISWHLASYLLCSGATYVVSPQPASMRPAHPEQLPELDEPLSLDDLIDLHEELDAGVPIDLTT